MPKRPGSVVLTFSKKNMDIRRLLENSKEEESFVVTDYICQAIRFYEKHKNAGEFHDLSAVKKLIDERLKEFMNINSTVTLGLVDHEVGIKERADLDFKRNINVLEMDLDDVPIDED